MSTEQPGGRWVRVPLPGNVAGIVLLLPDALLTPEQWTSFRSVLDAMRPGLVAEPIDIQTPVVLGHHDCTLCPYPANEARS